MVSTVINTNQSPTPSQIHINSQTGLFALVPITSKGFPDSSVGKESTFNAGDPGSIPGSGRSTGEGIDYLFQDSWASLVTNMVKNLPSM